MTMTKHGGKRTGAGAPKKAVKRIKTSITITPELYTWVKTNHKSLSAAIELALTEYRSKHS